MAEKNQAAVELARTRWDKIPEEERAAITKKAIKAANRTRAKLTPEQRSKQAKRAAAARWGYQE